MIEKSRSLKKSATSVTKVFYMQYGGLLCFLAKCSKAYRIFMVRCPSGGVRPASLTISNIFSKKACPIKAKFYVEPPWVEETKVCSRHLGLMTLYNSAMS